MPWQHHKQRQSHEYRETVERIRTAVLGLIPPGSNVLVVSKGDEELIELEGRLGAHFPQVEGGVYAGYYPADSMGAIEQLERLRADGADFLLFPGPAYWWLAFYDAFRAHLESRYRCICNSRDCVIYDLAAS
jgi:hypothetical protein